MDPLFFLSYASNPALKRFQERFFDDLCLALIAGRDILDAQKARIGFYDRDGIQLGDSWTHKLAEALRTCRVFVYIQSEAYFSRLWCGREWAVFRDRIDRWMKGSEAPTTRPPLMLPVLWKPTTRNPPAVVAADIQYDHREFGEAYAQHGLHTLMNLERFRDDYQVFLSQLSRRILQVADAYPLPPGDRARVDFESIPNAFAPKAFISYSWDDDAHREWVKQLAIRLRADGVDVTLDRWHAAPGDQVPGFMERAVRESDFVIAVCTPRFKERSDGRGGGVGYEGDIMTAYAFTVGDRRKFIPVLRRGSWSEAAPTWLLGRVGVDLSGDPYSESEYEELLRTLHGAREQAPPIGRRPDFAGKYYNKGGPLNEAKLIVIGRGGVGKTCLVNRLVHGSFNPLEGKTDGIRITDWDLWDLSLFVGEHVRLHVWDFGGQEIMHATHQFFLTERSLYLLALSGREESEDLDAEYWLRMARSFGGDAPVIVVLNKIKETPFNVNRTELRSKYPSIVDFIETDCQDGTGIETLRDMIHRATDRLENLRVTFPREWFAIKDALPRQGQNYLTFDGFRSFCRARGVTSEGDQDRLARYLHDLGVMLNYRDDDRLRDHFVLNPHWVTTGVYKIINADVLARNQGLLRLRDLADILDPVAYPRETHRFLLDLMKRFELCFAHPGGNEDYLVPQLLSKDQQAELPEFASEGGLRFRYVYPVIPEGLIPRFIVRTYTLSESQPRWRTGVVLEFESHRALVKADREARTIEIDVRGPTARGRRNLLAIIRSNFAEIHPSSLKPEAMVPVPGYPEVAISYEALRVREATGRRNFDLVVGTTVIDLDASTLLDGVDTEAQARSRAGHERPGLSQGKPSGVEAVRLFVSYAREDERMKDEFKAHIELLQVQGVITAWDDRMIPVGDEWDKKIHEELDRADIFVLLVSAKFLASKYCREVELPTVMRRHEIGQARVLPVIVRDCLWRSAPFAKLNTLPTDAKAVERWERPNSAWTVVAEAVVEAAKWVRNERARRP